MNDFWIWFSTGVSHILDLSGYDHILFVTLLVLAFPFGKWKDLTVLITGFTIGHSISLALSVLNKLYLRQPLIEFLIALSILVTAIYHLCAYKSAGSRIFLFQFLIVLLFGIIHGLGFSFLLRAMLGREETVILPLLYFNVGLEVGQLIIVLLVIGISLLLTRLFKISHNLYKLIFVCAIAILALKISAERFIQLF